MTSYLLPALLSFGLSFLLAEFLRRSRLALDQPNHRSLHAHPIPRTGGLALMIGMISGWLLLPGSSGLLLLFPVLALMVISFLDDLRNLSARWRFLVHMLAASLFVAMFWPPYLGVIAAALILLAIVWMTNLYNFMDGANGLAGGMAAIGFGFYGVAAWQHGAYELAGLNACIVAASLAFLRFNFHPAQLFLGDAGSIPLGFLSATLGVLGWLQGLWPLWFPALVFSPFILDATVTLFRRAGRGDMLWQAHREHYYQRLIILGWTHRRLALYEYGCMLMTGIYGLWLVRQSAYLHWLILIPVIFFVGIALWVEYLWRGRTSTRDY